MNPSNWQIWMSFVNHCLKGDVLQESALWISVLYSICNNIMSFPPTVDCATSRQPTSSALEQSETSNEGPTLGIAG